MVRQTHRTVVIIEAILAVLLSLFVITAVCVIKNVEKTSDTDNDGTTAVVTETVKTEVPDTTCNIEQTEESHTESAVTEETQPETESKPVTETAVPPPKDTPTDVVTSAEVTTSVSPPAAMPEESKPVTPEEAARMMLAQMTLTEKVYQLFVTTPEGLTDTKNVTEAGDNTKAALAVKPVGGLVYFKANIKSAEQIKDMVQHSQSYSKIPLFICVDEEGGRVSRLSDVGITDKLNPMEYYGEIGSTQLVKSIGQTLGHQIKSAGFNVDFAPVADVVTNPENTEIGNRSFSSDASIAAQMVAAMTEGLQSTGVISCLKHFPGHGSTESNSHKGISLTDRTLDELRQTEFLPFKAGIAAGADMVMISHMTATHITGDVPCDLSRVIVTELLRGELGFNGIITTDSHQMGAITQYYSSGTAAVMAISAGCDMVLMPKSLTDAANAVIAAVNSGTLSEARINESVLRILTLKYRRGIIAMP